LTFAMLLGLDGARIVGELLAGRHPPPREALDAARPDPTRRPGSTADSSPAPSDAIADAIDAREGPAARG